MAWSSASALSDAELIELSDLSFIENMREHARWTEQGVLDERSDTVRVLSATRFAAGFFNAAVCTGRGPEDPDAWLDAQRAYFNNHQRGFTVYLRGNRDRAIGDACARGGLRLTDTPLAMVCDAPVSPPDLPDGVTIDEVIDREAMSELAKVLASAYALLGMPESVTQKVLGEPERMFKPHLSWWLLRAAGRPAAAGMVLSSHTVAGIYWLGSVPDLHGRGLGEACVRTCINGAFARGARAVFAHTSRLGESVYGRLGFREITRYPWYLAMRS